jgi:hypothetical protein
LRTRYCLRISHRPIDNLAKAKHYQVKKLNHGPDAEKTKPANIDAPKQLAAKTDPISISKHPTIQAVLNPLLTNELLPLCSRSHARRIILCRKIKSEPTR